MLEALSFYAQYLNGQTNGLSDSLSIASLWYAMQIEGVPQSLRARLAWLSLTIHGCLMETLRTEEKMKTKAHGR